MSQRPVRTEAPANPPDIAAVADRLLLRIRSELLELEAGFHADSDLFHAGLDSMSIMQVILMVEEDFGVKLPDCSIKRETFSTVRRIAEAVIAQRTVA